MLPEELHDLIDRILSRRCEMQNIELKRATKGTPEKLYDSLSSFANQSGGGIILFGIDEKNDYAITGVYDPQDLQTKVTDQALQMEPVVRPVFTVTEYDNKTIVSAEIPECETISKPCFYRAAGRIRGSYIRVGESDQPMTEYEVYSYEAYRKKIRDELRTVDRAAIEDLYKDTLTEYFIKLRQAKPNLSRHTEERILQLQGLTEDSRPTVAGLLLLGEYPQAFFPQMSITAMLVDGTEIGTVGETSARFLDNKRIEGTIPQMLEEAMIFVRRNIRTATVITPDGKRDDRPEYPLIAVREVILNALIHRDYSVHTEDSPIRIVIYKDRLEVENPGGLYGRLTVNDLGKVPADTRNPFIAGNLEVMIDTENRFSGIPTIFHEMQKAGLPPPVFESRRGTFKTILYNTPLQKEEQPVPDVKPVVAPSVPERILEYCRTPRSKEEIAAHLEIRAVYYVVSKYLKPLVASGKLQLTIPGKPGSRNQKYQTVSE